MKNGTYLASHTPYGYRIENGEYVIVENEAEVVKQIFKRYLLGFAKKTIADMLNSTNVPNREGTPWQRSTVEYILGNERYTDTLFFRRHIPTRQSRLRISPIEVYITAVNKLREYRCEILLPAIQQTENLYLRAGSSTLKIKEIDREIAELSDKNILITRLHSNGIIRSFEYSEQISAVNSKITALRKERTRFFEERDENGTLSGLKTLNNRLTDLKEPLTEFDSELFAETVKGITVPNNGEVRIEFVGGLTVSEKIPDRRRCREK